MHPDTNPAKEAGLPDDVADKNKKDIKKRFGELQIEARKEDRRAFVNSRRFANPLASNLTDPKCEFSLDHLANVPNRDLLISKISEWNALPPQPNLLQNFFAAIDSPDILQQHYGIIGLRRILSQKANLPIQQVIDHNVVVKILEMAQNSSQPHIQMEATWCLANMASGTTEQTASLIQKNVIPIFVELARSPHYQIAEQAIWGLGNISGDCVEFRSIVMKSSAVEVLLDVYDRAGSMKIQEQIVWVFANICRLRPEQEQIHAVLKKIVVKLIDVFTKTSNPEVQDDALFGICKCTKSSAIEMFANQDFLAKLLTFQQWLFSDVINNKHRLSAVNSILGGLTSSNNNSHTMMVIKGGFLTPLTLLLSATDEESLVREVCWVLSNIAIGEDEQVRALLAESGLIPKVIQITKSHHVDLSKEAVWMLCNLCLSKNYDNIKYLIDQGGILGIFKECLELESDSRKITLVFEAILQLIDFFNGHKIDGDKNPLINTLIQSGIADQIEMLQTHRMEIIYIKALAILESHFILEEE